MVLGRQLCGGGSYAHYTLQRSEESVSRADPVFIVRIYFLEIQLKISYNTSITKTETGSISGCEAAEELDINKQLKKCER
jgi:hypothetical protein